VKEENFARHRWSLSHRCDFVFAAFSYLAKFLGNLDSQYESLFGGNDAPTDVLGKTNGGVNDRESQSHLDVKELSQKMTRYLKTSQRTIALPVGEVMLNRKERL
jgi:hypothetical protein